MRQVADVCSDARLVAGCECSAPIRTEIDVLGLLGRSGCVCTFLGGRVAGSLRESWLRLGRAVRLPKGTEQVGQVDEKFLQGGARNVQ